MSTLTVWHKKTLYAPNTEMMAWKVALWQKCEKETGAIEVQILPMTFDLREEVYTRVIRVYTALESDRLKRISDKIEHAVMEIFQSDQMARNEYYQK